jgi:hypothetical protein
VTPELARALTKLQEWVDGHDSVPADITDRVEVVAYKLGAGRYFAGHLLELLAQEGADDGPVE